jgi:hypothetical protein
MSNDKPFTDPQLDGHERFRVYQRNFGVSGDTAKTSNSENFNTAKTSNESPNESPTETHIEIPNQSLLTPCIDIKKTISRLRGIQGDDEYDNFHPHYF